MTPYDLQNELMKRMKNLFINSDEEKQKFNIYKQVMPEKMISEFDYSDDSKSDSRYPLVVVRVDTGEKQENFDYQTIKIQFIIGARNEGLNGEGYEDVMSAMQLVLNDLDKHPHMNNKAQLEYPLNWALVDENTYPYFFAGIETSWVCQTLNRVDELGGWLHGES